MKTVFGLFGLLAIITTAQPIVNVYVAFMLVGSNPAISPYFANFTMLPSNYVDNGQAFLQPAWTNAIKLYMSLVDANGGFNIIDRQTRLQIDLFQVVMTQDSPLVQQAKMLSFMNDAVLTGRFGQNYSVIIAPPQLSNVVNPVPLAEFCESTQQCILQLPITIDPTVFVCTANATGGLPEDCVRRNRHAGRRRYNNMMSTAPASRRISDEWLQRLQIKGMTNLAMLSSPGWVDPAANAIQTATSNLQQIVWNEYIDPVVAATQPYQYWLDMATSIQASNPNGLMIYVGDGGVCFNLMKAFRDIGFYPGGIHFAASCGASVETRNLDGTFTDQANLWINELGLYGFGVSPWNPRLKGPNFRAIPLSIYTFEPFAATNVSDSPAVFSAKYMAKYPTASATSTLIAAQAITAPLFIQKALEIASVDPSVVAASDISKALSQIAAPSHHDELSVFNSQVGDTPYSITQFGVGGVAPIVVPSIDGDALYPAPGWSERTYLPQFFTQSVELAMMAITTVSEFYALLFLVGLVIFREHSAVKAATFSFCVVIVLGCMLLMSTVYLWTLHENDQTCMAKAWTLVTGFATIFGALFLKTYRLVQIFLKTVLSTTKISNKLLSAWLAILLSVFLFILTLWTGLSPLQSVVVVVDPYRPSLNYTTCQSASSAGPIFLVVLLVLLSLLLATNAVFAYLSRTITVDVFNESVHIGVLVWLDSFMCIICVPLVFTSNDRVFSFVVRSIAIFGVSLVTISTLLIPKFKSILASSKSWPIETRKDHSSATVFVDQITAAGGKDKTSAVRTANAAGASTVVVVAIKSPTAMTGATGVTGATAPTVHGTPLTQTQTTLRRESPKTEKRAGESYVVRDNVVVRDNFMAHPSAHPSAPSVITVATLV